MPIRRALESDLAEITRIYNEAIVQRIATADTVAKTVEERRAWFEGFDERHPIWVDDRGDGLLLSYGGLSRYSPKDGYRFAAENFVYVSDDVRGKGCGRRMLEHVLSEARRLGIRYVLARIFAHNEASRRLHARAGFRELGLQRGLVVMDDRWYDVVLMDWSAESGG